MIIKYLILDPTKDLYWTGDKNPDVAIKFSAYIEKAKKFNSEQEAVDEITNVVPSGIYKLDKVCKK